MIGNLFNKRRFSDGQLQSGSMPVKQPVVAATDDVSQDETNVIGSSMMPEKRQDFTVLTHLDTRTTLVLNHAEQEARRIKQQFIEPEQLLLGLLFDQDIFKLFGEFSVDTVRLSHELQEKAGGGNFQDQPRLSDASKKIIEESYKSAKTRGVEFITPEDLLLSLFSSATAVSDFLKTKGLEKEKIEEKLSKSANFAIGKKSVLGKYGIDLTDQARRETLDPVVGRDKEVERLIHILLRRTKNNPLVIGDAGVGKTAIIEGLAQNIVKGTAPKDLLQKRIIQLDIASLVAGAAHRGEFEERLRDVIKETQASSGQIILFIDEIHNLIGAGGSEGTMDASNIVKPYLARGQLQIIGTTTVSEFRKYFEKDKAFERRFQPILVEEPTEEVAIEMLNVLKPKYENYHKVVITGDAVKSAVHLSKKYIGERFLPDKAVDLLDEASAEVKLKYSEEKRKDNNVTAEDIENVVSAWTGIPITKLTEDEGQKLLHLEELVHKRLINQENAVAAVSEAVRRGRIGLASANRPIASFIFLGPTGVGKTELAKVLAEILFGRDDAMIRLDMSEYMEKHEVAKLIGAPPGYVGYEEGGQLTEAVRAKPYSIVLLDEVEKAHPDVFNILLQLLEDGRLTDNKGNTISFKNTIIVATSNIGSALIQQQLITGGQKIDDEAHRKERLAELSSILMGELHKFFKPELLNRFDEVIIFEPLSRKNMNLIANLGIGKTKRLLVDQNINLEISETAIDQLAKEGYDPAYGARPLRRLIQTAIENPIALLLIEKKFIAGDIIVIDYNLNQEQFTFNKKIQSQGQTLNQPVSSQEINPIEQVQPTFSSVTSATESSAASV